VTPEERKRKEDRQLEQEANLFATLLLVPGDLLKKELEREPLNWVDDERFKRLCKMFDVSATTMAYRIALLKMKK
jgi:Zn-dependent peptidase ImmA (M78 family)